MPHRTQAPYTYMTGKGYHPDALRIVDGCITNIPKQRINSMLYDDVGRAFCLTEESKRTGPHNGHWYIVPQNTGLPGTWGVILPILFRGKRYEVRLRSSHKDSRSTQIRSEPGVTTAERRVFAWAFATAFASKYWGYHSSALLVPSS